MIVLVVEYLQSHEAEAEVISIITVQFLCPRQACMTCAIANDYPCVLKSYMQGEGSVVM